MIIWDFLGFSRGFPVIIWDFLGFSMTVWPSKSWSCRTCRAQRIRRRKSLGGSNRDVEGMWPRVDQGTGYCILIYYGLILCHNFGYDFMILYNVYIIYTYYNYTHSYIIYIYSYVYTYIIYIHIYLHIFVRLDQLPHFPPLRPSRSYSANGTRTKTWIACKSAPPSFSVSVMPLRVNRWGGWASGNRVKYCSNIFQKGEWSLFFGFNGKFGHWFWGCVFFLMQPQLYCWILLVKHG